MSRNIKITIDPGHGGSDPGAVVGDVYEKDIALAVSMFLVEYLPERFTLIYTREKDNDVPLSRRTQTSNSVGSELFVSIHANAAENINAHGIETFHFPSSDYGNNLASCVQKSLIQKTDANDRRVKTANFYVLRTTRAPAILVELGFITNETERQMLIQENYQKTLAKAISCGIVDYVDNF